MSNKVFGFLFIIYLGVCHCDVKQVLKESNFGKHHSDLDEESLGHQAVLGSKKDDEHFDEATPEESRAKLESMFYQMDENNDEKISKEELKKWIAKSLMNLNIEAAQDLFQKRNTILDEEGDNQISWREYVMETYSKSIEDLEKMEDDPEYPEEERMKFKDNLALDRERFDLADVDKNFHLSEVEHAAFVHPYDYPHMVQAEVSQYLAESDKNKDGKISVNEYIKSTEDKENLDIERMNEERNFNDMDKDKNGFLDIEELTEMLRPDSDDITDSEAEHLFDSSDTDQDDYLTLKEVLKDMDEWIGSEATSFGEFTEFRDEL